MPAICSQIRLGRWFARMILPSRQYASYQTINLTVRWADGTKERAFTLKTMKTTLKKV